MGKMMLNHMDEDLKYAFEYSTMFHMVSTVIKWFVAWVKARCQDLTRALYECKMDMRTSMRDHVVTMVDYISQLRPLGVHVPDEFAVELILASFPGPFYRMVVRIRDTMEQRIRNILAESRAGPPSTGIFYTNSIDVFVTSIDSNSWVFGIGSVTHICNTMQGLRKMRKLKKKRW